MGPSEVSADRFFLIDIHRCALVKLFPGLRLGSFGLAAYSPVKSLERTATKLTHLSRRSAKAGPAPALTHTHKGSQGSKRCSGMYKTFKHATVFLWARTGNHIGTYHALCICTALHSSPGKPPFMVLPLRFRSRYFGSSPKLCCWGSQRPLLVFLCPVFTTAFLSDPSLPCVYVCCSPKFFIKNICGVGDWIGENTRKSQRRQFRTGKPGDPYGKKACSVALGFEAF